MDEPGSTTARRNGEPPTADDGSARLVVDLRDAAALDSRLTGSKAAALSAAAAAGLDTLPGVVLTTAFAAAVDAGAHVTDHPAVRQAFLLAEGERRPLVARSSSVLEDTAGSSMAGQFDSVIGITGFDEFVEAVRKVLDSRGTRRARRFTDRGAGPAADRAPLRRCAVRHRPGFGSQRPPCGLRGRGWARAARERRGRRVALRARHRRQDHRLRPWRRARAPARRPEAPRRAVG